MSLESSIVIIPTYNEAKTIVGLVKRLRELYPPLAIMIVDDNSPDRTADHVAKLIDDENFERLFILSRSKKMGIGSAYRDGMKQALTKLNYKYFIQMDADLSHDPEEIGKMIELTSINDLIIGSRYYLGMRVVNWSIPRLLVSYFGNLYARLVTGMPIQDCTSGFTCISRKYLKSLQLHHIKSDNYSFQVEYKYRAWLLGAKIVEHPITFKERKAGKSKFTTEDIAEAALDVLKLRLRFLNIKFKRKFLEYMNKTESTGSSSDSQGTELSEEK